jgi:hypothetical protein
VLGPANARRLDDDQDLIVVPVSEPVEGHCVAQSLMLFLPVEPIVIVLLEVV